jgi:hypothetical protein
MWTRSTRCESTHCVEWRKSSRSMDSANCVEWRTASVTELTCVEVATNHGAQVRDSKDPTGPVLSFDASNWTRFIGWVPNAR